MEIYTFVIEAIVPDGSVRILRLPHHLFASTIRAHFHDFMEVKTVLNLEADSTRLCQDSVTNSQEVGDGDYQKNLDTILLNGGE